MFRDGARLGQPLPPTAVAQGEPAAPVADPADPAAPTRAVRAANRAKLVGYFADDITIVEEITGWDLTQWRTYREGGTYSVRKSWAPSRRLVS